MAECKVSVIIPCYNAERYIDTCMNSLLRQTIGFENLEIILIDDASRDDTLDKLSAYEKQYPENVMIIHYDTNQRQGYARNLGIQYSTAKYITFLDVDDYVADDMMETLYHKMEEDDYDYAVCNYYRVIGGKPMVMEEDVVETELCYNIQTIEERKKFILTDTPFKGSCGTFYRRDFILDNQIHYAEGMVYEDLLWLGLIRFYAKKVCVIPQRLYYYVNWDNSSVITKPNSPHHFDRLKVMRLFLEEVKERGLYDTYKQEAQMHFLQLYYINSISFFALHFTACPLAVVEQMRQTVLAEVPEYETNPYIKNCYEFEQTILSLIRINPQGQQAWNEIFIAIREAATE